MRPEQLVRWARAWLASRPCLAIDPSCVEYRYCRMPISHDGDHRYV